MTYLVTGGFGCIGSYVIRDLLEAGEQVVVYDLKYDLTIPNIVLNEDQINQIIFVGGDIVGNLLGIVSTLGDGGLVGLIAVAIILYLINKNSAQRSRDDDIKSPRKPEAFFGLRKLSEPTTF